ncbi:RsmD family RNA methyltransferase [Candidatus Saccharibacteria bacterium]|nr:RsmD family RNA methyltransferase [Candidatus Saccharibacteria bacterium]
MRIISGTYRNFFLASPVTPRYRATLFRTDPFHPMGDRQRSGLFNALFSARGQLIDARVLDAYAGTGSIGLEALSRGAAHATFLEKNPAAVKLIRENVSRLKLSEDSYRIIQKAVEKYDGGQRRNFSKLQHSQSARAAGTKPLAKLPPLDTYDIIFADPPYNAVSEKALISLAKFLKTGGIFVLSCPSDFVTDRFVTSAHLSILRVHTYARAKIVILKKP